MLPHLLRRFFAQDIAMDLGTANTLLFTRKHGIVINEPSVVAVDVQKNTVLAELVLASTMDCRSTRMW